MDSECSRRKCPGSTIRSIARSAAAARAGLVLSFVDLERPTAEVHAVERLHRARCIRTRHFDEPEATWLPRVTLTDRGNLLYRAVRSPTGANRFVGGRAAEVGETWVCASALAETTARPRRASRKLRRFGRLLR